MATIRSWWSRKWASLDALKAHIKAPHMVAYGQKVKDLQADRRIYVMSDA